MAVARRSRYQEKTQRTGIMTATELPGLKRGIDMGARYGLGESHTRHVGENTSSEHPGSDPNDTSFFARGCCIQSNWEWDC